MRLEFSAGEQSVHSTLLCCTHADARRAVLVAALAIHPVHCTAPDSPHMSPGIYC